MAIRARVPFVHYFLITNLLKSLCIFLPIMILRYYDLSIAGAFTEKMSIFMTFSISKRYVFIVYVLDPFSSFQERLMLIDNSFEISR